ncbi:C4-dicarboxylate TRAP transporter substrate-binding protein [Pseudogemmobacter sonorensis]|uniref:C4-dicarboxylate TRAP transporter substrate-binding protein n=1 Tax=Pseudogemmobacter sonorensis TaxID=2989681 RepID=UPI0036CB4772
MQPGKTTFKTPLLAAGLGLALAAGLAAPALAQSLNYSVGLGPDSAPTRAAHDYAASVAEASGGAMDINVFSLELLSLAEMSPGLRDGLTDIGYVVLSYFTAEYAHSNLLAELSMIQTLLPATGKESLAFSGAMAEYITTGCEECLAEFKAQNQVYLGSAVTPPYMLLCNKPISTVADLRGKRLRIATTTHKRLAEHFGAVGVQIPVAETYEAISQGIVDCTMSAAPELTNFRLIEVVSNITEGLPGNVFGANGSGNINLDVWNALTVEQRELMLREAAGLTAGITWNYHAAGETDIANALALGKTVLSPDAELAGQARSFVESEVGVVADNFRTNYGVARADEMQQEFALVLERWAGLVADVDNADDLAEIYWSQIFSKLDPASYGVN